MGGGGSGREISSGTATASTRMRQHVSRMSGVPSASSSDASSCSTLRPGRSTRVATRNSAIGTGRRMSNESRTVWPPGIPLARTAARASSAAGGPACCCPASHGPRVYPVEAKPSPSGS